MRRMVVVGTLLTVMLSGGCGGSSTTPSPSSAPTTRVIGISGNLAFGSVLVGESRALNFSITNTGTGTLTVTSVLGSSASFIAQSAASWASGTIAAGGSQVVTITFSPTASGNFDGTLRVVGDQTSGIDIINVSAIAFLPTPPPTPSPTTAFYVWGGQNQTQYLGFFTCIFCTDFGSDSINNEFGKYGSQFSSTSIRNEFSQYGSPFSTFSACNEFAGTPPRVYNANLTVYYGELTLNQFRAGAIKTTNIVNWLKADVCRH